jgi:hypothetical protein
MQENKKRNKNEQGNNDIKTKPRIKLRTKIALIQTTVKFERYGKSPFPETVFRARDKAKITRIAACDYYIAGSS